MGPNDTSDGEADQPTVAPGTIVEAAGDRDWVESDYLPRLTALRWRGFLPHGGLSHPIDIGLGPVSLPTRGALDGANRPECVLFPIGVIGLRRESRRSFKLRRDAVLERVRDALVRPVMLARWSDAPVDSSGVARSEQVNDGVLAIGLTRAAALRIARNSGHPIVVMLRDGVFEAIDVRSDTPAPQYVNARGERVVVAISKHALHRFGQRWSRVHPDRPRSIDAKWQITEMINAATRVTSLKRHDRLRLHRHGASTVFLRHGAFTFVVEDRNVVTIEISQRALRHLNRRSPTPRGHAA